MNGSTPTPPREDRYAPPFSVRSEQLEPGTWRVEVRGELDIASSPELNTELLRQLLAGHNVELDLSLVTFLDARALGTIMGAGRRFERRARSFVVRLAPASQPHRLLRLTGILDTLSVTGPH